MSYLVVNGGLDCALSAASRTVTGVAERLEPFDGPHDIWMSLAAANFNKLQLTYVIICIFKYECIKAIILNILIILKKMIL